MNRDQNTQGSGGAGTGSGNGSGSGAGTGSGNGGASTGPGRARLGMRIVLAVACLGTIGVVTAASADRYTDPDLRVAVYVLALLVPYFSVSIATSFRRRRT